MNAMYEITEQTEDYVLIRDVGHALGCKTVTNDAERIVSALATMLNGRRLEYIDSDGDRNQLVVKDGEFAGFKML